MAFRIVGTTDEDREWLRAIRELAWREHQSVSMIIREAFALRLELGEETT